MKTTTNEQKRAAPKAVLCSDIHFSISTLDLASSALTQAINKAKDLKVPLIIAGDLHDTKALLRGEVVNRIISIMSQKWGTILDSIHILIGNHDLINEKGKEDSLNFLNAYATMHRSTEYVCELGMHMIPYHSDLDKLQATLRTIPKGATIVMHQGIHSADMGHYVHDKSAAPKNWFKDFRVISGHYHRAQDIKCGPLRKGGVGLFSYIGSPYTVSFAEAKDGLKGFRVLYADGTLELVPTNLRKHIVVEREIINACAPIPEYVNGDLVWMKLRSPKSLLDAAKKEYIGKRVLGHSNFKLDKISKDMSGKEYKDKNPLKDSEVLDRIIERCAESEEKKDELRTLWRSLLSEGT